MRTGDWSVFRISKHRNADQFCFLLANSHHSQKLIKISASRAKLNVTKSETMDAATSLSETPISSHDSAVDSPSAASTNPPTTTGASGGGGMFKKRAKTSSAMKGLRKPVAPAPTITISDDDESDDEQTGLSKDGFAGRKRKRGGIIQAASTRSAAPKEDVGVVYDVKRTSENLDPKSQATAVSAEFDKTDLRRNTASATPTDSASDNVYRGQKNYKQLVPKREQITTKYNSMGPQKAASNIRMTTYTDYAPGIFPLPLLQETS